MSKEFVEGWSREKRGEKSLTTKIREDLYPTPLRDKITNTNFRLKMAERKLEQFGKRTEQKDRELFQKCVRAQERKDSVAATIYANECAQLREVTKTIYSSQLPLERVILRLDTIQTFGDTAVVLSSAAANAHAIKDRIAGVAPQASHILAEVGETMDRLVMEVGEAIGIPTEVMVSGEEAEKTLTEAISLAEQKMKERLPGPPSAEPERGRSAP